MLVECYYNIQTNVCSVECTLHQLQCTCNHMSLRPPKCQLDSRAEQHYDHQKMLKACKALPMKPKPSAKYCARIRDTRQTFRSCCTPGNVQADDIIINGGEDPAEHVDHPWTLWEHAQKILPEGRPFVRVLVLHSPCHISRAESAQPLPHQQAQSAQPLHDLGPCCQSAMKAGCCSQQPAENFSRRAVKACHISVI